MSELVVVTGVSGFVGMQITATALNAGYRVRATLRKPNQAEKLTDLISKVASTKNLEFATADLLSDQGWDQALEGADFVIHAASPLILGKVEDESDLIDPAVKGTKRVLDAALKQKVKRVVITSTGLTVAGHITEGAAGPDDFTPIDFPGVNLYTKSKIMAEQVALEFASANPAGPAITTIHPGVIIGPPLNPDEDSESIGLFKGIWQGKQPAVPAISFPMADIRDVADVHVSALAETEGGLRRYLVSFTTEPQLLPQIAQVLRANGHKKAPRLTIPIPVLKFLSRFNPEIKSLVESTDGKTMMLDCSATMSNLDWKPMSFEQSVLDTAAALEGNA